MAGVRLALRGTVLTPSADGLVHHRDGAVLVDAAGRVAFVGRWSAARRRYRGPALDVRPAVIVPGFVDTHLHFPQTRIIGQATGPLLDWLKNSVFPEEARFRKVAYARAVAEEFVGRMLRAGTTTAAIFSSSSAKATDVLFECLSARGMRAVAGLTLMDARSPKALKLGREPAMKACRRLVKKWHEHDGGRLRFAMTPRFALSCSRAMLRDAGKLARDHGLLVQTHIGETLQEGEETLAAHRYASHYVDVYDRAGLLGERTVLAHCIHLSQDEWNRIRDRGASIAHCPDSNFFLGSGRMRVAQASRRGISIGLGSDIAAGRSFSMQRAMASAYDNAMCVKKPLSPVELFEMATVRGAEVLGCADVCGSLEIGKDADMAVVRLPAAIKTQDELLAELVFDNDQIDVEMVFVRGKRLAPGSARS
jgi:guanine deaminase